MHQEPMNMIEFMKRFQSEEQCRQILFKLRWPDGFVCPVCGHREFYPVRKRHQYHCRKCEHQESVTAHTIFHGSHTPLSKLLLLRIHRHSQVSLRTAYAVSHSMPGPLIPTLLLYVIAPSFAPLLQDTNNVTLFLYFRKLLFNEPLRLLTGFTVHPLGL
jgi:hypothetical protein